MRLLCQKRAEPQHIRLEQVGSDLVSLKVAGQQWRDIGLATFQLGVGLLPGLAQTQDERIWPILFQILLHQTRSPVGTPLFLVFGGAGRSKRGAVGAIMNQGHEALIVVPGLSHEYLGGDGAATRSHRTTGPGLTPFRGDPDCLASTMWQDD